MPDAGYRYARTLRSSAPEGLQEQQDRSRTRGGAGVVPHHPRSKQHPRPRGRHAVPHCVVPQRGGAWPFAPSNKPARVRATGWLPRCAWCGRLCLVRRWSCVHAPGAHRALARRCALACLMLWRARLARAGERADGLRRRQRARRGHAGGPGRQEARARQQLASRGGGGGGGGGVCVCLLAAGGAAGQTERGGGGTPHCAVAC